MDNLLKILAKGMIVLTILVIIIAIYISRTSINLDLASKVWLWGTFIVSFLYSFLFLIIIFIYPLNSDQTQQKILTRWNMAIGFIVIGAPLFALFLTFFVLPSEPFLDVVPSLTLAISLVLFDLIAKYKIKVDGSWKKFVVEAESIDFSVAIALFVALAYCTMAWFSHGASASTAIKSFSAGASAFSLSISTGTFSWAVIRS